MLGTKTSIASLFIAAASFSLAAAPEYFPLQSGNSWVYRGTARSFNNTPQTIEVEGTEQQNGRDYSRVRFLGRTVFLRATDTGINILDVASGQETSWLVFDAAEGQSIPTA